MREFAIVAAAVLLASTAEADVLDDPVITHSGPLIVTTGDNGKTIALNVGQCIDVQLMTQAASTGYQWYLAPGLSEAMSLAARTVTTPGNAVPGTPEKLDFILCAAAPGKVPVAFAYYRPWEKNTPPAKTLRFTVKIAK